MKIRTSLIALTLAVVGITPATAAAETRTVTGVSAYYRVDLGYMVGWTLPSDTSKITGYTVTATPGGKTCSAGGGTNVKCVFSNTDLGYTNTYTFTVVVNSNNGAGPASAPSNAIKAASIPSAPQIPLAKVISDTQIDIAWVPNPSDGGAPLYGYRVHVWPSSPSGDPISAEAKIQLVTKPNTSVTGLKPSTMYIINVASCNAYGCNSADKWTYISTTGPAGLSKIKPPMVISGGSATTTCWDRTLDAGNASSTGVTINKNAYKCTAPYVDPATYPKVDPSAINSVIGELPTKFAQSVSFGGYSKQYSISEWSKTGGNTWFAYFFASSKSVTLGFTIPPVITSNTPATCKVEGEWIKFLAPGTCTVSGSVGGNNIWKPSGIATTSFLLVP
jgi:hypothetical protein